MSRKMIDYQVENGKITSIDGYNVGGDELTGEAIMGVSKDSNTVTRTLDTDGKVKFDAKAGKDFFIEYKYDDAYSRNKYKLGEAPLLLENNILKKGTKIQLCVDVETDYLYADTNVVSQALETSGTYGGFKYYLSFSRYSSTVKTPDDLMIPVEISVYPMLGIFVKSSYRQDSYVYIDAVVTQDTDVTAYISKHTTQKPLYVTVYNGLFKNYKTAKILTVMLRGNLVKA